MIAFVQDTRTLYLHNYVSYNNQLGAAVVFFTLLSSFMNEYNNFVIKYGLIASNYDYRLFDCPVDSQTYRGYCRSVSFVFNAVVISQVNSSSVFLALNPGPMMSGPNPGGDRYVGILPVRMIYYRIESH